MQKWGFQKSYTCISVSDEIFTSDSTWCFTKYTTLQCTTIHYTTLHYNTLHYNTLHYNTIRYNTPNYKTLHYNTIHYNTIHFTTIHCTTIHYTTISLQYNTLQYATIQYITLQYTTLHGVSHLTWLFATPHASINEIKAFHVCACHHTCKNVGKTNTSVEQLSVCPQFLFCRQLFG